MDRATSLSILNRVQAEKGAQYDDFVNALHQMDNARLQSSALTDVRNIALAAGGVGLGLRGLTGLVGMLRKPKTKTRSGPTELPLPYPVEADDGPDQVLKRANVASTFSNAMEFGAGLGNGPKSKPPDWVAPATLGGEVGIGALGGYHVGRNQALSQNAMARQTARENYFARNPVQPSRANMRALETSQQFGGPTPTQTARPGIEQGLRQALRRAPRVNPQWAGMRAGLMGGLVGLGTGLLTNYGIGAITDRFKQAGAPATPQEFVANNSLPVSDSQLSHSIVGGSGGVVIGDMIRKGLIGDVFRQGAGGNPRANGARLVGATAAYVLPALLGGFIGNRAGTSGRPKPAQKQAGFMDFLKGTMASGKAGIPWYGTAMMLGGMGGLAAGYKGMDYVLDKRREADRQREMDNARQEFHDALLSQYDAPLDTIPDKNPKVVPKLRKVGEDSTMTKVGKSLDDLFDQFSGVMEKSALIDWGNAAGTLANGYGMYAGLTGLVAGAVAYDKFKKRSRGAIIDKALQRRERRRFMQAPTEVYAVPEPVKVLPRVAPDEEAELLKESMSKLAAFAK